MAPVPKTMNAFVVQEHKKILYKTVDVPKPAERQVLVRIVTSGVCHTDCHVVDGDFPGPLPIIPGHEGCGYVAAVGPGVHNISVGDRVGVPWVNIACGSCHQCIRGEDTSCHDTPFTGYMVNGCFAEYVVAGADYVGRIPAKLSFEQAAPIMCAGVTSYKALKVSNVKPSEWVVITGAAGGLGHVACQYAKAMGMRVVAMTRKVSEKKEKMFKSYGVDYILDLSLEGAKDGVMKATDQRGANGVIILAPNPGDTETAQEYCGARASIVLVGLVGHKVSLDVFTALGKQLCVKGSSSGNRSDLAEALEIAARGKVKCEVEVRKFSEMNTVLDQIRTGGIAGRVVLKVSDE
eukprot:Lankesteria_metandrocarpae@DN5501_c0_g1_i1.p1